MAAAGPCDLPAQWYLAVDHSTKSPIENASCPVRLGRKKWLFSGGTRAGPRATASMSLGANAKASDLCPLAWLTDVLTRLLNIRD